MVVVTTSRYAAVFATGVVILVVGAFMALPLSLFGSAAAVPGTCGAPVPVDAHGHYSQAAITALWVGSGGSTGSTRVTGVGAVSDPVIAGAVGMAESGGDPGIVNSIGAGGLMQINPPEPDYLDPATNMQIAVRKWKAAHGWTPWEAFTGSDGRGDDGPWRRYLHASVQGSPAAGGCSSTGRVSGSPQDVIDRIVLPICNANGITLTPAEVEAANATHGPTVSGGRSDHQGPPDIAWAADMSNGVTTPQEDALAAALAKRFGIPWSGSGLVSLTRGGYRFQLIYRTLEGGDHFNHVHFGVRVVSTG
jgi:hypothetical protein